MNLSELQQNPSSYLSTLPLDVVRFEIETRYNYRHGSTVNKSGKLIRVLPGFVEPSALLIDSHNRLIVKELNTDTLKIVDLKTDKISSVDGFPSLGQDNNNIAINSKNEIIYHQLTAGTGQIIIRDLNGSGILIFGIEHETDCPYLACDSDDKIYVSDSSMGYVIVYDQIGRKIECFSSPANLSCSGNIRIFQDRLVVINPIHNTINIFSLAEGKRGEFIRKFPISVTFARHQFTHEEFTCRLTCDSDGNIILSAAEFDVIAIFSMEGELLRVLNIEDELNATDLDFGASEGRNVTAENRVEVAGIAVDHHGHIWIADIKGNRLLQFD